MGFLIIFDHNRSGMCFVDLQLGQGIFLWKQKGTCVAQRKTK